MRVKFISRTSVGASETATSTPIFITYFITTCFLFSTCWTATCAQRVFWMYSPLPQINGLMGYNGDDYSASTKSVLMLLPTYPNNKNGYSQETFQRSIIGYNHDYDGGDVPVITPLIVRQQHGSVLKSWPGDEYYKRNEKIKRRIHVQNVLVNQNILDMGKREEDQENDDNSGSAEEARYVYFTYKKY